MKILSSISHPHVVPNLYSFTCSVEHKIQYFKELLWKLNSSGSPLTSIIYFFPTLEGNGAPKRPGYKLFSKYLPLCSTEQRNVYRLIMTEF